MKNPEITETPENNPALPAVDFAALFDPVATWKARLDSVKGLEDSLRADLLEALVALEGLQAAILAQASTDPSALGRLPTIPTLPGVSFAWRKDAEIIAPDEVPREWCTPDTTRIRKAALAGVQIPGVALVERRGVTVR